MAIHSGILAWRIPWTEEPGRLQSIGSGRVGQDRSDLACMHASIFLDSEFRLFSLFCLLYTMLELRFVCTYLHIFQGITTEVRLWAPQIDTYSLC